ncbi:radical SAM protein [Pseudodesulfovibrio cashew]|uniref:Radical SAM protein n=1 Tax=Pseudodesulfovibrio cashew TaxID=2678688 RepID=A0A6I6JFC5_9BACT|nr:radical SAM protein [Pseudodesulfovibrio cashew]QGY40881.1 radical SAM protein [Pseudodesulfovibrio cashew]
MKNIVFVQKDNTFIMELGITIATLRDKGYNPTLLSAKHEHNNLYDELDKNTPLAIGVYSDVYDLYKDYNFFHLMAMLREVKSRFTNTFIFMAGVQPAMYPESLAQNSHIDCFVIGDAEIVLPNVLNAIETGKDISDLDGIAVYQNDKLIVNKPTEYVDFSQLPLPDVSAFTQYPGAFRYGHRVAFARGCPNNCSFCFNHVYKANYAGKNVELPKYYSAEYLTQICELLVKIDPTANMIYFTYSTFTISKAFFQDFIETYSKRVGLPYIITTRLDCVDDEIASLLKSSGCSKVTVGIESGNEYLRNTVLNKNLSNKAILNGMKILKKHGLRVGCNFIMGFPKETLDNAIESLDMYRAVDGDFLTISMFAPLPSLALTDLARKEGCLEGIEGKNYSIAKPNISTPDIKEIQNLTCLAPLYLKVPSKTLIKFLCRLPHNSLFELVKYTPRIATVLRYDLKEAKLGTKLRYLNYACKTALKGIRPKSSYQ